MVKLCQPAGVHWCDGSESEYQHLCDQMVKSGTFIRLNEQLRPGSYLARSHPSDVARVEDRTFICAQSQADAGPTNHWAEPGPMKQKLRGLFQGSHGRPNPVRHPLQHGTLDVTHCQNRN